MLDFAKSVLEKQSSSILKQAHDLDNSGFLEVLEILKNVKGKIIVTGVGKSGLVGGKISSSFSSLGSPSFFIYPSEFQHGDFGAIQKDDIIFAISNSGETEELFPLLEFVKENKITLLSITKNKNSTLAKSSKASIILNYDSENLENIPAPTVSTTLTLAVGDALACSLVKLKSFSRDEYKKFHPGGAIGRDLKKISSVKK